MRLRFHEHFGSWHLHLLSSSSRSSVHLPQTMPVATFRSGQRRALASSSSRCLNWRLLCGRLPCMQTGILAVSPRQQLQQAHQQRPKQCKPVWEQLIEAGLARQPAGWTLTCSVGVRTSRIVPTLDCCGIPHGCEHRTDMLLRLCGAQAVLFPGHR